MSDAELDDISFGELEDRIRDLRIATESAISASTPLLDRIESALDGRSHRRWPKVTAIAAVLIAIVAMVRLTPLTADRPDAVPTAANRQLPRLTHDEYAAAMSRACRELVAGWVPRERPGVATVGPTYSRFDFMPASLASFLQRLLAAAPPRDAENLHADVRRKVIAAMASAQSFADSSADPTGPGNPPTQPSADALGDLAPSGDELEWLRRVAEVSASLTDYGADGCQNLVPRMTKSFQDAVADGPAP
jgi:hypothetical protein